MDYDYITPLTVMLSLFADDAMYHYSSFSLRHECSATKAARFTIRLATKVARGNQHGENRGNLFYTQVHFQMPPLTLEGKPIAYKSMVKYLGVQIGQHLNFNDLLTETFKKARSVRAKLYPKFRRYNCLAMRTCHDVSTLSTISFDICGPPGGHFCQTPTSGTVPILHSTFPVGASLLCEKLCKYKGASGFLQ